MAAKRARTQEPPLHVDGDDAASVDHAAWQAIARSTPSWEDAEFPASQLSIDGKAANTAPPPPPAPAPPPGTTPRCKCGADATKATVSSETPNKGRPYWHCPTRKCGYFAWADGAAGRPSPSSGPLSWARFPALPVVSDFGFRAADLRQGGVGDCWFLSALAVVAERHDLIARLFADTASNRAGCYCMHFFLDGAWTSVLVDDRLPVTAAPRRPELAFDGKLAFSRCGDRAGGQQLWASLLEKAYAKAHGSYQAISGGEISEALLDLTGAPTLSVDFSRSSFDSEMLWRSMVEWKRLELPMGCATDR